MMPHLSSVFLNWMSSVQMKVVRKVAVDFEMVPDVTAVVEFDAVIVPMKPRDVDRKPEGLRAWRRWEMFSETKIAPDTVVQDPEGVEFRVDGVTDWSQGGFYKYDIVEQPHGV